MDITARKPTVSGTNYPALINALIDDLQQITDHYDTSGHFNFDGSVAGSITASAPFINATQTWNSGGVTFTAAKVNITDTASAAGSFLLDLQVGGASKFNVLKSGNVTAAGTLAIGTSGMTVTGSSVGWGFGVTPSPWSQGKALEVNAAGNGLWGPGGADLRVVNNYYYNSGDKFAGTGYAQALLMESGTWTFKTSSASGTAGNAATMSTLMTLSAAGLLTFPLAGSRVFIDTSADQTEATAQLSLSGSGYSLYFWADATAAYIGQNSGARELRMYAGGTPTTGVKLTNGATSWVSTSDENLKYIIEPILNAGGKVSSMRHVIGRYKSDAGGKRRSFLIAQDVQKVLPEAVHVGSDGALNLAYTEVIPLHGAAISEHESEITALRAEFEAYKEAHP